MRRLTSLGAIVVIALGAMTAHAQQFTGSRYLASWVGDADGADSDFLAILDVNPDSKTYTRVLATAAANVRGTLPHHTEHEFLPGHPLFANGFAGNKTVRFDLSDPMHPRLLGELATAPGLAFPHTFVRLPNGNILATMQASGPTFLPPGGLAEYRDNGSVVRTGSAANDVDPGARPYSLIAIPEQDRVVVSCGRMILPKGVAADSPLDHAGSVIQLWRLSDLHLLKTIPVVPPGGSRANIERNPYEVRRTPAGDIFLSTGSGGLFRISGLEPATFRADLVYDFGGGAYLPVMVGHYWIQAIAPLRRVVALDIKNPATPFEISRVDFDDRQSPHWLSLDPRSNRIIVANASDMNESRLWMLQMDVVSGWLRMDNSFHDPGNDRPGVSFDHEEWPHGRTGRGVPHGSVFLN